MGAWRRLRFRGALVAVVAVALSLPVAAYGGSTWTIDRTPSDGGFSQLAAVSCVSVRWCAAVGYSSGLPRFDAIAEIWNGSRWTITSIPVYEGHLFDVSCVSASWCAAAGYKLMGDDGTATFIAVWNGHAWRQVPSPDPGSLNNILYGVSCVSRSSCLAVGTFGANSFHLLTERWDGHAWKVVSVSAVDRAAAALAVSCVATNACFAVGDANDGPVALRWDGHTWSSSKMPTRGLSRDNLLTDLSCLSTTTCVAVGASGPGVSGYGNNPREQTLVETWNGKRWRIIPSPNRTDYVSVLSGVSCISAEQCTAVGRDVNVQGGKSRTLIEIWDGRSWRLVSTPNRPTGTSDGYLYMHGSALYGVSCVASACTAAGLYQDTRHTDTVQTLVEARR